MSLIHPFQCLLFFCYHPTALVEKRGHPLSIQIQTSHLAILSFKNNFGSIRLFFKNVKGLTYSTAGEDYRYYLSCLKSYEVDIAGLAETNTCWTHPHICSDFRHILRRQYSPSKVTVDTDSKLADFLQECNLFDLHHQNPAPSTYIGSASRRIDFIFGCNSAKQFMSRSGTLSYWEGPQSDHRGLYIDIKLTQIFQKNSPTAIPFHHRSLHTGNPEHVQNYQESMMKYYSHQNMMDRIDRLFSTHHTKSREEVRVLLTSWDNDQGRAMEISESLLRIPYKKKYRWSPALRNSASNTASVLEATPS